MISVFMGGEGARTMNLYRERRLKGGLSTRPFPCRILIPGGAEPRHEQ